MVPRDTLCRGEDSEDTKQNAATRLSPRRETALSSEKTAAPRRGDAAAPMRGDAAAPTRGDAAALKRSDAAAPTRGDAAAPTRGDAAALKRGDAVAPIRADVAAPTRGDATTSWTDAVKTWADGPDDELPPIPSSWLEADIPTKGFDDERGAPSHYERGESSATAATRGKTRAPTLAAPSALTRTARTVECPTCQMDISSWTLADREAHADQCVERCLEGPHALPQVPAALPAEDTSPWTTIAPRRRVAARATAAARAKGKAPAQTHDASREALQHAPTMIMTRSRQAAADAAASDAATHGSAGDHSGNDAEPAAGPLGNFNFVRLLHANLGHPSATRLAHAIHNGSIIIPELERHMRSPDGSRSPPPLNRIVSALRAYQCPHCASASLRANARAPRKLGKDVLPWQVAHADLVPVRAAGRDRETFKDSEPLDPFVPHPGYAHLLLVVDEATRYTLVAPCKNKSAPEVAQAFLDIDESIRWLMRTARERDRAFAESMGYTAERIDDKSRSVIPHLHSDNGNELMFGILAPGTPNGYGVAGRAEQPAVEKIAGGFAQHGAPRGTTSDTYRPYENGLAERRHQILKNRAKALMSDAGLGWKAYAHAYRCAAASENLVATTLPITGTRDTEVASPFARVLGFPYDTAARPLAPFGAIAITKEPKHKQRQFGTKKDVGVYLGPAVYPDRHLCVSAVNDYGFLSVFLRTPETKVLTQDFLSGTIAQRAEFLASQMGAPRDPLAPHRRPASTPSSGPVITTTTNDPDDDLDARPAALVASDGSSSGSDSEADSVSQRREAIRETLREASQRRQSGDASRNPGAAPTPVSAPSVIMTRSRRAAADAAAAEATTGAGAQAKSARRRTATDAAAKAKTRAQAKSARRTRHRACAIRPATGGTVRRTIDQCTPEEIDAARRAEYANLVEMGVFEPAVLPAPRRGSRVPLLDTKEVLKVRNDDSVKCRLTARGFLQRENIDYYGTYSPVTTPASIRIVVCLAATFGAPLKTADAASAYLQARCSEEIYVALPRDLHLEGVNLEGANCFRLRKGLYGTKQAGRSWFYMLSKALIDCGLEQAPEDPCLYFRRDGNGKIEIALCTVVDDLLGAATDEIWEGLMTDLQKRNIKLDLQSIGDAVEFNGMRIRRTGDHAYELLQGHYVDEVARAYTAAHGDEWRAKKDLRTPLGPSHDRALMKEMNDNDKGKRELEADQRLEADPKARKAMNARYAGLLGSILWAAVSTRPDVAFAASAAGQVASHPMSRHLKVLEHVLSYLVQTKDKGLVFDHSNHAGRFDLAALSDADFASEEASRRSRTGVWLGINGSPVYWVSKRQRMISDSTTAAETIAAFSALRQVRAIAGNLNAMGFRQRFVPLLIDNAVTLMRIVDNRKTDLGGAKHLSVITRALQEAATPAEHFSDVWPVYVSTYENVADIFTKGYLSGQEAAERWSILEQRARGVPPPTPPPRGDWVETLLHAKRASAGTGNRLTEAIELNQPVTSLKEYYRLSGRGARHGGHFGAPSDLGGATHLGGAAPRAAHAALAKQAPYRDALANGAPARRPVRKLKALEIFCGPNKSMEVALQELTTRPDLPGAWTLSTDTLDVDE